MATGLTLVLLLTACGADPEPETAPEGEGNVSSEAFPVTIEHKYGETEITAEPERIVTIGLLDQDAFIALGVPPVGVTDWYGEHPNALWPWARDALGNADPPEIVGDSGTTNFEKVAAQAPDVIVALYSGLTEEDYETLSQIAPTVAQPNGYVDYGIPWQELTLTAGKIVGRTEAAEALVTDVEKRIASVPEEHPEFAGATAVVATPYEGIYVYGPEYANGRFLTSLGFEIPEGILDVLDGENGANLSPERVDLLDVDAIVWLDAPEGEAPLTDPLYERLDVHKEGREVLLESAGELGGGSFISVLSLPILLEEMVPMLAAAIDGDPNTEVE